MGAQMAESLSVPIGGWIGGLSVTGALKDNAPYRAGVLAIHALVDADSNMRQDASPHSGRRFGSVL